jgi:geranylgeranyl diphosphate synthase, type II
VSAQTKATPDATGVVEPSGVPELIAIAQKRVDAALDQALARIAKRKDADGPDGGHLLPGRLLEAMRYAVLSPGKRLRPALVLGGARAVGARIDDVLPAACAVEMVHAYSLVHDDLPAMDDDDLRRGRPTCHRAFDEATALLAGDALLTEAVGLLADGTPLDRGHRMRPRHRIAAVRELARAAGAAGMIGGQQDDVDEIARQAQAAAARTAPRSSHAEIDLLLSIHRRKTGRLIQASCAIGALYAGAKARDVRTLREFGANVGLAFQLVDDALDGDGVAAVAGAEYARKEAQALTERAVAELRPFGRAARPLIELVAAMAERRT